MSEVRHQLLITLVHGTWPRGLFPRIFLFKKRVWELARLQRPGPPPPFWFEEGSSFLTRLSTDLGDISHKITPLLWSGANKIFVRDKTAHRLAEHLSAEHAERPQATQLVIAHSHGGNIALRALHLFRQRFDSHLQGADAANPLVVTLATPFIEVHQADFGERPDLVRIALVAAIGYVLYFLALEVLRFPELLFYLVVGLPIGVMGWYWIARRATARQNRVEELRDATRLGELVSARPLLVIRAIDDEASLILALGAIVSYITARSINFILYILVFFSVIFLVPEVILIRHHWLSLGSEDFFERRDWYEHAGQLGIATLIITLLGLLSVARAVHGRELAVSPMECQINTQSAPDATGLSEIVTLVQRTYVKSLRHGIYDHEDCAKTISDWVLSQLRALPVR
jgi:hypothetical protein